MGIVSLRLSEEEIKEIDKLAQEQHIDRSNLLRQILANGIKETKLKLAREYYEQGDSLGRSAERSRLSIWDVLDYFEKMQITQRFDEEFWMKMVKEKLLE
jgi:hypothetical protein